MPTLLTILLATLKDLLLALVAKVAWKAIAERFFTRAVVWGLKKLRDYSTNDVVDETLNDVINSLSGKRLHVIENEVAK